MNFDDQIKPCTDPPILRPSVDPPQETLGEYLIRTARHLWVEVVPKGNKGQPLPRRWVRVR